MTNHLQDLQALAKPLQKLNLGCGKDIKPTSENWLNVDAVKGKDVQYLDIFSLPWPFEDCKFDMILASHVLEHVPFHIGRYGYTRNFLVMFMEEIWRVLKPGGRVEIIVPGGLESFASAIDHKRIITAKTFHIFYPGDKNSYYTDCRFKLVEERRQESIAFKAMRKIMRRFFGIDIDHLSSQQRTIILQRLESNGQN